MTTEHDVSDGQWHQVELSVLQNNVLSLYIDGEKAGFEIDIGTGRNVLISDVDYYILGLSLIHI